MGDSLTEGVGDPDGHGSLRGWADRFAEQLAARHGDLRYANLAIRGMTTAEVAANQLDAAVALRPELVSCIVGMNDLIRPMFDAERTARELDTMVGTLSSTGATVVTATLPDPGEVVPMPAVVRQRFSARMSAFNAAVRETSATHGAHLLDLVAEEQRHRGAWGADRLHPGGHGHQLIADMVAELLFGARPPQREPAEPVVEHGLPDGAVAQLSWAARHVAPWLVRRLSGKHAADGLTAKLPGYATLTAADTTYRSALVATA